MTPSPLTDDAGQAHQPAGADARIISLVPSLTELLFDMDLTEQLVGRTSFCIHPKPGVNDIPSVGGTKRINMEKVAALAPTHALVNIDETPKQMADTLAAQGIAVIVTHPIEVADNRRLFELIGGLFDRTKAAERLIAAFDAALAGMDGGQTKRRALYLIWQDPWMTISRDTYISKFLALAGWQTVAHNDVVRYPEVTIDDTLLDNLDDVLFSTEPYTFSEADLAAFADAHPAHAAKARLIDAEMVSWYGSRSIAGLSYLQDFAAKVRGR